MSGRRPVAESADLVRVMRQFGERLRWLRLAWEAREPGCHSQAQWAKQLGVDKATVSRWEGGLIPMPPDMVWRVAMGGDASADYLYLAVLSECMEPWLRTYLRKQHPALVSAKALRDRRAEARAMPLTGFRPVRNRGGRPSVSQ